MVTDKQTNKIFLSSLHNLAFTFASAIAPIIYTNIYLQKLMDNICYFHEKQLL